ESWLVADQASPTPDRPSGVYDGDTLTITAYEGGGAGAKPAAAAKATPPPAAAKATPPPAAAPAPKKPAPPPPQPAVAPPVAAAPQGQAGRANYRDDVAYEQLPEGEGDP